MIPNFKVDVDHDRCIKCERCTEGCTFDVLTYDEDNERIIANDMDCVACQRCMSDCPVGAIRVTEYDSPCTHPTFTGTVLQNIERQAQTGSILVSGTGSDQPYPSLLDQIVIDACQVTNPPIDPLREPIELRTYLGKKNSRLRFDDDGEVIPNPPNVKLETPIMIAPMSYGAISLEAHKALLLAAKRAGTVMGSGEGGLHDSEYEHADSIVVQVASGRFGVHIDYLMAGQAIEIKIGQGAKPGIGGHLPGEKVDEEISRTRFIPAGTDALSPAPHHDIYSIEDLQQLIWALKEATDYEKPVFVKVAAVHHIAAISSGIASAGADAIVIDGFKGGTGAAPEVVKDHLGIPVELAVPAVDRRLREEGMRSEISIIASGGVRHSADVAKLVALGADAVAIGTAALVAMGCKVCRMCYTGRCPYGICTQNPELRERLDMEQASEQVYNLINAWNTELKEILGALGMNSIESLRGNRDRLRGIALDQGTLDVLEIKPAGR